MIRDRVLSQENGGWFPDQRVYCLGEICTLERRTWTPAYLLSQENSFTAHPVPPM